MKFKEANDHLQKVVKENMKLLDDWKEKYENELKQSKK